MNLKTLICCGVFFLAACGSDTATENEAETNADISSAVEISNAGVATTTGQVATPGILQSPLTIPKDLITVSPEKNATRSAFFGDLHVHTSYSSDAFAFGTRATPYDAYLYARRVSIKHPVGFHMTLRVPMDFYAVTARALFVGV